MKNLVILLAILLVSVLVITGCSTTATTTKAPTTTVAPITTAVPTTTAGPTTTIAPTTTAAPTTTVAPTTTAAPTTTTAPTTTATARPVLPAGHIYWDQVTDPQFLNKIVTVHGPCIGTYMGHDRSIVLGTKLPAQGTVPTDVNVGDGFFLVGLRNTIFWPDLASLQQYVGHDLEVTDLLENNAYTGNLSMQIGGAGSKLTDVKIVK
jgi:hypothetical protein